MRIHAQIEWDGDTMEVVFETECSAYEVGDDEAFYYGWMPTVGSERHFDGWIVTEVYGEDD